ncbi:MAG: four helix bundle protein [Candidatus Magasanikbacteria bacterium]|nr:four helix bundle protein [Candidatus Magasanikbacteria bacterium]
MEGYTKLGDVFVYKISLELCEVGWQIYERLDWHDKKIFGDQFIRAVDSVGANIAEGYGRFHYLDRIKFYYNSRGSLFEVKHWCCLLYKRGRITVEQFNQLLKHADLIHFQLNLFIKTTYQSKQKEG